MTRTLDVLVIESRLHAADESVRALETAGHTVLRCQGDLADFPCRGLLVADDCPLAHEPDVALVVRPRLDPHTTPREVGVVCAVRAGIPLVEFGPEHLDPYEPWLTRRVRDGDVVAACEAGVDDALDVLRREILRRVAPTLAAARIHPSMAACHVEPHGRRLRVRFELPSTVTDEQVQALAVRVHDAVRTCGRTYGQVDVSVSTAAASG